ncbi:VanZ family protein [Halorubrum cibi]|uniref:VanZ like family protein n=1 Tax=Halorubrum cibi TaxID=413815 RepID=A0A521EGR0_9EURY|nr:VanZ family protein [Halorubrum cibi]SMO82330.1 VanZ like family protein [Halorubrum cibi]
MSDSNRDGASGTHRDPSRGSPRDRWRPAIAFAAVVLTASVVPVPGGGSGGSGLGLGLLGPVAAAIAPTDPFHFVGYAVLAALSARATGYGVRGLVVAAAVAVAFGFGVEVVQTAIPWRTFAWRDSLVNAVGAIVGVVERWIFGPSRRDADAWSPPS